MVCISARAAARRRAGRQLCKRLKKRLPDLKVVVALWMSEPSDKLESRLHDASVDVVVTRLPEAIDKLRELVVPLSSRCKTRPRDSHNSRRG